MATVGELEALVDRLWPKAWAESFDNVGLLVGDAAAEVRRVLVALDADRRSLDAASAAGARLLLVHHPLPFRPLRVVRADEPVGALVAASLSAGVAVCAVHTNADVAPDGTSDALAQTLGLQKTSVLHPTDHQVLYKLVVFVPAGHEDAVLRAVSEAGAGHIGRYSHCSFAAPGTGTFLPLEGANPYVGQVGSLHRQSELRLEVIVPEPRRQEVVAAMLRAHPYEEVAYDLLRLENPGPPRGYGLVGELPQPKVLAEWAEEVGHLLRAPVTRVVGKLRQTVRRVAVVGGAGAAFIPDAVRAGADVLVTADVRYHEARDAEARGLALIDPGHQATEWPLVPRMAERLRQALREQGAEVEVTVMAPPPDVWQSVTAGL